MKVRLRVDSWWSAPTTPHMAAKTWSWSLVVAWRICSTQRFGPKFHGVCGGEPGPTGLHGQHKTMIRYALHSRPTAVPSLICVPSPTCFYDLEVLVVTTRQEINAPATTGGSRAHLSRHRCTSKSRPVTDLFKPKSEFKKKIQPKNACLSSFLPKATFVRHTWLANVQKC